MALLCAVLAAALASPTATAANRVEAVGAWSMVPQSKDADGDGFIDGDGGVPSRGALSRSPSSTFTGAGNRIAQPHERLINGSLSWYLSPTGFPVRLDACDSTGAQYRWRIEQGSADVRATSWKPLAPRSCRTTVNLPEGRYDATLEVRDGARRTSTPVPLTVRNVLIVSLGDSYASGEGNPRNVRAWLRAGGPFDPYWDDDSCRRSTHAAPAQAALALEQASPATSVTLVHLACSGASVDQGILGPQQSAGQSLSQVEQATALLGGRAADVVLLSIGGNDVGFGTILETCALTADCPTARPRGGPLAGYPTVNAGVQAQTGDLAGDFTRIAACIGGTGCRLADGRAIPPLALSDDGRVLPTLYPDITRDAVGESCRYLTITPADFGWARSTILDPAPPSAYPYPRRAGDIVTLAVPSGSLNEQIAATARLPRWQPVTGTWTASGSTPEGHGVCAGDMAWVFGVTAFSGFPSASFHPDPRGQAVLGRAVAAALAETDAR